MKKILFNNDAVVKPFEADNITDAYKTKGIFFSKKRSKSYLDMILKLDAKSVSDTTGMKGLLEEISREFGTPDLASLPIGIVSKCFLGAPYDVHIIDISQGTIVNHYKVSEQMPDPFARARTLAIHNAYAMVEIYKDKMILIREDGTATKIEG